MFRTKSFADIAAVFPYSRSSGKDKEKWVMPFKDSSGHVRYFIS